MSSRHRILSTVYAPGSYTFESTDSFAKIADALIGPVSARAGAERYIAEHPYEEKAGNVVRLVRSEFEKMPDLVPLPPQDLTLDKSESGDQLLRFTTVFYNKGKGPLELRADPVHRRAFGATYNAPFSRGSTATMA